ncbi:S41 family peptidase [Chloroflexota bacterium]
MPKRTKIVLALLLLVVSMALSFSAGCVLVTDTQPESHPSLDKIEEAWQVIFEEYVEKDKLDADKLSEGAIKGMLEALDDPYSNYLDTQGFQLSRSNLGGEFEGIGAYVGIQDEQLTIITPIPGSPAETSGIRALDIILEVDDIPTQGMNLEEAVLHIRGPEGTTVRLLILHQDSTEAEEIEIVRAAIEIPSVTFEMREDTAYIRIHHFSGRTNEELSAILEDINQENTTGIILDVRSNPGGLLDEVVDVASHFLEEGVVVYVVDNQGNKDALSVQSRQVKTTLPMVALSDNFSASASEVLIGALQDHDRATIAGTKTFGKGSVNTLNELKDGSGLYITIARWLTPNGSLIEGEGIEPDYTLELKGDDLIQWAIDYLKSNQG